MVELSGGEIRLGLGRMKATKGHLVEAADELTIRAKKVVKINLML